MRCPFTTAADHLSLRPTVRWLHSGNRPADLVPPPGPGTALVVLAPLLHRGKCPNSRMYKERGT